MHIINRVFRHPRRQRSLSPIGLLRTLQERESEITLEQCSQAKFANAKKTSCDQCVEDSSRNQLQTTTQHSQIVVGTVQDNFLGFQRPTQWLQIGIGQRIDYKIANNPRGFMALGHTWA